MWVAHSAGAYVAISLLVAQFSVTQFQSLDNKYRTIRTYLFRSEQKYFFISKADIRWLDVDVQRARELSIFSPQLL